MRPEEDVVRREIDAEVRLPWTVRSIPGLGLYVRLDRRAPRVIAVLAVALASIMVLSVSYGEFAIAPADVLRATFGQELDDSRISLVVRSFRLPRVVLSALVGMALGLSGAVMQGLTRNDLADPALLGVNSGASVVVVGYLVIADQPSTALLPWLALGGALAASLAVFVLAGSSSMSPTRLILVGVGIASMGAAITNFFLTQLAIEEADGALRWLAGSVYASTWDDVRLAGAWLVFLIPLTLALGSKLDPLMLGESVARGLGARVEAERLVFIVLSAALAAITVVVAGTIGFVGFVAPHIARRLTGPTHQALLPVVLMVGALLLVSADLAARWALSPNGLPVGVATALIGAPYFAYLLRRRA